MIRTESQPGNWMDCSETRILRLTLELDFVHFSCPTVGSPFILDSDYTSTKLSNFKQFELMLLLFKQEPADEKVHISIPYAL